MHSSKVTKSSKGLGKLFNFARPFNRGASSEAGRVEGPDSSTTARVDPHASQKRAPERKLKSRGTLLEFFQRAILCINATRDAMEEDIVSDYGGVMDISPCFIERAQRSDSRFIEATTVFGLEVKPTSLARAISDGQMERHTVFNPMPALINHDVSLINNTKSFAARNGAHPEISSERVAVTNMDPFGEGGNSFYAEEFMNTGPSTQNINDLSFYFAASGKTISVNNAIAGLNHPATHRLLPLNKNGRSSTKETFYEGKPCSIVARKKVDSSRVLDIASSGRPKSTGSQTLAPKKGWSISKHVVKHSTTPRYTMDANGMPVRRPRGKARIQRLYYIHNPTLPMIEEEDPAYHVMELVPPESSPSVADSVSVYSQDSYISQAESVSSPELADIVAVDSEVHDIREQNEEGGEHADKSSFIFEDEDNDEDDDDIEANNAMFSEISTAISRSRERRQGVYGREQLYVRTYAAPLLAIAKERQQSHHHGYSRTGLRPLLLPISVSLRGDSEAAER